MSRVKSAVENTEVGRGIALSADLPGVGSGKRRRGPSLLGVGPPDQ